MPMTEDDEDEREEMTFPEYRRSVPSSCSSMYLFAGDRSPSVCVPVAAFPFPRVGT